MVRFRPEWMFDPYSGWIIDRFPGNRGVAIGEGKLNFGLYTSR